MRMLNIPQLEPGRRIPSREMRDAELFCVCDLQYTAHSQSNLGCDSSLNLGRVANGRFSLAACKLVLVFALLLALRF
jgi:hypothetical protein